MEYNTNNIQNRNIALWIILSIVTCGIGLLVWLYYINEDMQKLYQDDFNMSSGLVVLISLFCGVFLWYWSYKQGQRIDSRNGIPNGNKGILYLLLSIFGLSIVTLALIQDELNNTASTFDSL